LTVSTVGSLRITPLRPENRLTRENQTLARFAPISPGKTARNQCIAIPPHACLYQFAAKKASIADLDTSP